MKKQTTRQRNMRNDNMRPEYDFKRMKGGVRGKYYKAYRAGHTVKVHKADGRIIVRHFRLQDGAVVLEPQVRKYFHDSEEVNKALRGLIALLPKRHGTKAKS